MRNVSKVLGCQTSSVEFESLIGIEAHWNFEMDPSGFSMLHVLIELIGGIGGLRYAEFLTVG